MSKIISFISQKGGVGKSTLAQALAVELTAKKYQVLLADCDPQQQTSFSWYLQRKKLNLNKFDCLCFPGLEKAFTLFSTLLYDFIIVDGPARFSVGVLLAARNSQLLIQPTGASVADLAPAIREFKALQTEVPASKLYLAFMRIGSFTEIKALRAVIQTEQLTALQTALFEMISYRQASDQGYAITEVSYHNLRKTALALLAEIISLLERVP